jgi:hypothetical protein
MYRIRVAPSKYSIYISNRTFQFYTIPPCQQKTPFRTDMGSMGHKKEAIEFIILHTTTGLVLVSDKNKTLEEYFRTLTLKLRIAEAQVNPL